MYVVGVHVTFSSCSAPTVLTTVAQAQFQPGSPCCMSSPPCCCSAVISNKAKNKLEDKQREKKKKKTKFISFVKPETNG